MGPLPPERWEEEVLFTESDLFFADLLRGLDQAKNTITLETYIFAKGLLGDRVATALRRAAERGVRVEVLVDGIGSPTFWSDYGSDLRREGVIVKLYRSWPWQAFYSHRPILRRISSFFNRMWKINRGNHRKTCIVDKTVGWIGSMNVSDVHLREVHGRLAWIDVGVRVRGPELQRMVRAFAKARSGKLLNNPFQRRKSLLLLTGSFLMGKSAKHHQLWWLKQAKRHIWIQTPYFVPVRSIYRALMAQARQGVSVRVIVPSVTDVPLVRHLSFAYYYSLIQAGVRIFEYGPAFAHQKIAHFDDWTTLGSSNFNHRSVMHDLEVDVVLTDPANIQHLWEKFQREEQESTEVSIEMLRRLPWGIKLWSWILLAFRYWI